VQGAIPRVITGKIRYAHGAAATGWEQFTITAASDGSRTLRCLCRMDDDGLTRDVVYTVDSGFRPIDCYIRLSVAEQFTGVGWFRFFDNVGEGEVLTATAGRMRQRLETAGRVNAFGSHPICSDIWKLAHLKPENVGQPQMLTNCMNSSSLANGGSGPLLARRDYTYIYRGAETVSVDAGTFECQRYDWPVKPGKTLCMWTTGEDFLPVRMTFPEEDKSYDLVELSAGSSGLRARLGT